jgi:hypothetical protein
MVTVTRSQFSNLFFETELPALEIVMTREEALYPEFAPLIADVRKGRGSVFQATQIWGPGSVAEVPEGGVFPDMTMQQGFPQTLRYRKYGGRAPVTREAMSDSRFSDILKGHRSLTRSIQESRNLQFASLLINGVSVNGPDGVPLFSASHPTRYGGVQSNLATVGADLDYANFMLACTDFIRMRSPEGHYIQKMPATLLVSPFSAAIAYEITAGGTRPDVADRAVNVIDKLAGGKMPRVVVMPHLDSLSDDWGLFSEPGTNGIVWIDREKVYYNAWSEPSLEADLYQGAYRSVWGHIDYIGSYWNQG